MSRLNSVALIFSDNAVEPRMSANRMDISTSAPPGNWRAATSHMLQKRGFKADCCLLNNTRAIIPPIPLKGVLQNLQRGSCGSIRMIRRRRLSTANAFVENQNHHTLPTSTDFLSFILKPISHFPATYSPLSDGLDGRLDQGPSVRTRWLDTGDRELVLAHPLALSGVRQARPDSKI